MNYDNLTVESIAQYCAEKSGFKINTADLESQIQHLIDIEKAKQLNLTDVLGSKTLESKIANKRERIKGDLKNAKNIINGNKGMSIDYIIDKTRNMPFLRCKLNLIDELLEN